MEMPDLRGPYDDIDNVHTLLYGVARHKERELNDLINVHTKYLAHSALYKKRSLAEQGWTAEELEVRYQSKVEARTLGASKAARAALQYYELYKDEIHEQANHLNSLHDWYLREKSLRSA